MGRSWVFILLVVVTLGVGAVFYYSSDYYAQRSAGPAPVTEYETPIGPPAEAPATAPAEDFGIAPGETTGEVPSDGGAEAPDEAPADQDLGIIPSNE